MRLMAVERPISWCIGHEIDRANLSDPDIDGGLRPRGLLRYPTAVGARDDELNPMQMNRVVRHAEIAHANADLVSLTGSIPGKTREFHVHILNSVITETLGT